MMNSDFTLRFRDEGHLRAHLDHFAMPLDEALEWVRSRLSARSTRSGWAHFDFQAPKVTGKSGLRRLRWWSQGDFWAPRRGRSIPSHLILGQAKPTRWLCVWGFWDDEKTFVLHTLYPGRVAPREIHDPELSRDQLPAALKFWTRHAIVVRPGEWES